VQVDEIRAILRKFILDEFLPGEDPEALTDETPLMSGGILDSISTLRLIGFVEQRFGVEVKAHEMGAEHLDTLESMTRLIQGKLG
jgi:acyl carrier protein